MNITEFRQKYPQYNDVPDMELAQKFHDKYYSDMPFNDFAAKFGVTEQSMLQMAPAHAPAQPPETPSFLQKVTRGFVDQLPVAGAMFGGAAPAIVSGGALAVSPLTVATSGLGMAGGESLKQLILENLYGEHRPVMEQFKDIANAGVEGAKGEMIGGSIAAGTSKLLAPFASKMTAEQKALAEYAKKNDIPLSPDVLTESQPVKWTRELMDTVPPGSWSMNAKRAELATKITQARDKFISDTLKLPAAGEAAALKQQTNELYAQLVKDAGGDNAAYAMPNLKAFIESNLNNPDLKTSKKTYDSLMAAYKDMAKEEGKLPFSKAIDVLAKAGFGKKYTSLTGPQLGLVNDLKTALDADMGQIEEVTGKALTSSLQIAKESAKSGFDAQKSGIIERMLKYSTDYDPAREMFIFKPIKFQKEVENKLPQLQKMFAGKPEVIEAIQKFAKETAAMAPDISRLAGSRPPSLFERGAAFGASATSAWFQPWLAVPAGFDVFMAHSMMNPNGWMKQWMTTGFKPETAIKATGAAAKMIQIKTNGVDKAINMITPSMFNKRKDEGE